MPELMFETGERILCFHGPLVYEAKILKAELWTDKKDYDDGSYYFVHYKGWKQKWDEWVPESRVLKYTGANLKTQSDLQESFNAKKAKQDRKSGSAEATQPSILTSLPNNSGEKTKKRPRESTVDREEEFARRPELKIAIPEPLKSQLVDDWEMITKNQRLVTLPRTPTVNEILQDFRKSQTSKQNVKDSNIDDTVKEVVAGLRLYFDKALGNILLYRFERQQYMEMRKRMPDIDMSDLYGAEHLLRLFVQLPSLIAHTNMEQGAVVVLKDHFTQILQFLLKNQKSLFLSEYENVTPAYIALMKG